MGWWHRLLGLRDPSEARPTRTRVSTTDPNYEYVYGDDSSSGESDLRVPYRPDSWTIPNSFAPLPAAPPSTAPTSPGRPTFQDVSSALYPPAPPRTSVVDDETAARVRQQQDEWNTRWGTEDDFFNSLGTPDREISPEELEAETARVRQENEDLWGNFMPDSSGQNSDQGEPGEMLPPADEPAAQPAAVDPYSEGLDESGHYPISPRVNSPIPTSTNPMDWLQHQRDKLSARKTPYDQNPTSPYGQPRSDLPIQQQLELQARADASRPTPMYAPTRRDGITSVYTEDEARRHAERGEAAGLGGDHRRFPGGVESAVYPRVADGLNEYLTGPNSLITEGHRNANPVRPMGYTGPLDTGTTFYDINGRTGMDERQYEERFTGFGNTNRDGRRNDIEGPEPYDPDRAPQRIEPPASALPQAAAPGGLIYPPGYTPGTGDTLGPVTNTPEGGYPTATDSTGMADFDALRNRIYNAPDYETERRRALAATQSERAAPTYEEDTTQFPFQQPSRFQRARDAWDNWDPFGRRTPVRDDLRNSLIDGNPDGSGSARIDAPQPEGWWSRHNPFRRTPPPPSTAAIENYDPARGWGAAPDGPVEPVPGRMERLQDGLRAAGDRLAPIAGAIGMGGRALGAGVGLAGQAIGGAVNSRLDNAAQFARDHHFWGKGRSSPGGINPLQRIFGVPRQQAAAPHSTLNQGFELEDIDASEASVAPAPQAVPQAAPQAEAEAVPQGGGMASMLPWAAMYAVNAMQPKPPGPGVQVIGSTGSSAPTPLVEDENKRPNSWM